MKRINLLDNITINKIAAGEVVERPGSVIKELVENSIDAGASAVIIEIKDGGISYMRVSDNGHGIEKEDAEGAFLRHATSKISAVEDLERVLSMGFRGEALASIASVAQVELTTKTKEAELGIKIEYSGGRLASKGDFGGVSGTTVIVRNIFFNVPARRKFLKKPSAEAAYISDIINKLALGHPEISFKYINSGNIILHTPGNNDLKTVFFHVFGKEAAQKTIPIRVKQGEYSLSGLIGSPDLGRANRSYENLYVNGRFVKNELVSSAVEAAYKTRLIIGRFPVYALKLEISPALADINVHPAKLEVRFSDEAGIYEFFYEAVGRALKDEQLIPKETWSNTEKKEKPLVIRDIIFNEYIPPKNQEEEYLEETEEKKAEGPEPRLNIHTQYHIASDMRNNYQGSILKGQAASFFKQFPLDEKNIEEFGYNKEEAISKKRDSDTVNEGLNEYTAEGSGYLVQMLPELEEEKNSLFKNYKIIGQIFSTYWLVEQESSIYLIDQHAAHERILFEKFMEGFKSKVPLSQQLVEHYTIHLGHIEKNLLKENEQLFKDFGFELELFEDSCDILAVPQLFGGPLGARDFLELLDTLQLAKLSSVYDTKEQAVATMACKAAVKGHDKLSTAEARALIEQLLCLENPFSCPHGRPTIIEMSKYELEKKFKRIQ